MATVYVSPTGTGNSSGTGAGDALPFTSLNLAIDLAGPGGTVIMLADKGAYNVTAAVNIYNGGTAAAPVTVMGADSSGHPMDIVINGTRPANYSPANDPGSEVFKLLSGADNLIFENMTFNDVGVCFRVGADISNLTIENMAADNVRRFFEDYAAGTEPTATISGLTISDVDVSGFSKGVIRLQYDTNDVVIDDVHGDSEHQDGDGIAMGVHLEGTVHNVTVSNSSMDNAVASGFGYWNGDGFASERDVYNVTFKDCSASGNADGGFDLKSSGTTLINPVSEGNAHNYRFWGQIDVVNPIGIDPTKQGGTGSQYQIQFLDGAVVTISGGYFADSGSKTVLVINEGGKSITFSGTEFYHAAGASINIGGGIYGLNDVTSVGSTGTHSSNGWDIVGPVGGGGSTADKAPSDLQLSSSAIAENATYGTVVGTIAMPDPAGTGACTFKLSDDAGGAFAIDAKTGQIKVINSGLLNFEGSASLSITAVVTNSVGSYTETFKVGVVNRNEAPDGLVVAGAKVLENAVAGTIVATVAGHDPDALDTMTYKLVDNAGGRFVINPLTGVISVAQGAVIDYEQQQSITLSVTATDAAGLTLVKPVVIAVGDVAEANLGMIGTLNNDVLTGTAGTDYAVNGLGGNDRITTGAGADTVKGGAGDDWLSTGLGNDKIVFAGAADGFDMVNGGLGTDVILAGATGTVIGLGAIAGIETISSNGFAGVTISGSGRADLLDFSAVTLDGIASISGGNGYDKIVGSAGSDRIFGNAGGDQLTGGGGADVFAYLAAYDTRVGRADVVRDFMAGVDKIDLSAIDASTKAIGNQGFAFIGNTAFTGVAGQLRVDTSDPNMTRIYGDLNGDMRPDFQIDLVGSVKLNGSDFVM